jgi:hypothetical protein
MGRSHNSSNENLYHQLGSKRFTSCTTWADAVVSAGVSDGEAATSYWRRVKPKLGSPVIETASEKESDSRECTHPHVRPCLVRWFF